MGLVALVAASVSAIQVSPAAWLLIWLAAAATAATIGIEAIRRRMKAVGLPLWCDPSRRFAQKVFPPMAAGVVLTILAVVDGSPERLPTLWLLLYGAGVMCGAEGCRILRGLGLGLMGVGLVSLALPSASGTLCLAVGFGGLNVLAGLLIARRHGR